MKNVLLLGDSIRQNYQEYVKEKLRGVADVYYPNDNGRFCQYTLRYIHEWVGALSQHGKIKFDIVHFNCGLWDILCLSNEEKPFTGEEQYAQLLKRITDRIKFLCPECHIIFALTTKVIEPGFEPGISVGERRNTDIEKYNQIAKQVFGAMQVETDDLWRVSDTLPDEAHSDMVHFETELGIEALGSQVVDCLRKYCGEYDG